MILGGRGKCGFCGEYVNNVSYHEEFECEKNKKNIMNDKNKKEIKISKIEIKIGDKTLELTPEEALELKDVLNKTFPDVEIKGEIIKWIPYYIPSITSPYVPQWKQWETICSNDGILTISNKIETST